MRARGGRVVVWRVVAALRLPGLRAAARRSRMDRGSPMDRGPTRSAERDADWLPLVTCDNNVVIGRVGVVCVYLVLRLVLRS